MKFLDDLVDYCKDFTGCPEIFVKWAGLYALSAVAGRKHYLRRGNWNPRPNIWVLILGNSSSFKSVGLQSVEKLLWAVCPQLLASQEYSHEAFIEDVAKQPHRVFFYDEAESYLKMLAQKYNPMMRSTMMKLYAGLPHQRSIKGKDGHGETHTVTDAYLCWSGASTPYQISAHLNGSTTDFLSGMFPRFIIVPYFGKETYIEDPPPDNQEKFKKLSHQLDDLYNRDGGEYSYSPNALGLKHEWVRDFTPRMESADMLLSAFYKKMRDEHFHKIAILSAFERNSFLIEPQDVQTTIDMLLPIEREWKNLLERLTEKEWDRDILRVEFFIKRNLAVDREELLRGVRGLRAQKLTAILEGLKQDNRIEIVPEKTSGRTRTIIRWNS